MSDAPPRNINNNIQYQSIRNRLEKPPHSFLLHMAMVKNWLDGNDRNHILRQYSPRIWTIPFDKMAKSWKFMRLDITMIFKTIKNLMNQ